MTIKQAKQISLADYLQALGYLPVRQNGGRWWYFSPIHSERTPSFKVNIERNQWYDFGIGRGGSIIDFVMQLHHTNDVSLALKLIESHTHGIVPEKVVPKLPQPSEQSFTDIQVKPLEHPALLSYLRSRCIENDVSQQHCKEIHYAANGKRYFAVGFPNRKGGYELRNSFFKGCIAPKDITFMRGSKLHEVCCVFEGFMDFLSYLMMKNRGLFGYDASKEEDYLILNSISNLRKAIPLLADYPRILSFLDNDKAGQEAYLQIANEYGDKVCNMSVRHPESKDVNDQLCKLKK